MSKLTVCGATCMKLSAPSLFPHLPPDCKPIATSARRHSSSDEAFIRKEVQALLRDGIIEKSQSPWRAQELVTSDKRHKRCMVTDYSRTINKYLLLDAYPIPCIHNLVHDLVKHKVFSQLGLKSA